jgi:hypothetical protein
MSMMRESMGDGDANSITD